MKDDIMSTKVITEYVDFEVDLDEWTDEELINEIEDRGYQVIQEDPIEKELTPEELETLRESIRGSEPGTILYAIYEKIRKR